MRNFALPLSLFCVVSPAASLFDPDSIFYPGARIVPEAAAPRCRISSAMHSSGSACNDAVSCTEFLSRKKPQHAFVDVNIRADLVFRR